MRLFPATIALLFILLIACSGDDNNSDSDSVKDGDEATVATATPVKSDAVQPSPTAQSASQGGESVSFRTVDGAVTVQGRLFSVAGPKQKAVIFLTVATPNFPADGWDAFARELVAPGITAVTFALPAYTPNPGGRDVAKLASDVETAVGFIKSRDYAQIYVVGELEAGTAALKVAAKQELAGVITVSSPAASENGALDARPDLANVQEPKLFFASEDAVSPPAVDVFMSMAPDPKLRKVYSGNAKGTHMLTSVDAADFKQRVRQFLGA